MVFLTPALPTPRESPCRTYSWRDSIPCGHRLQSVPSFPSPTPFYLREESPTETISHRTEGVRGVCGPPSALPALLSVFALCPAGPPERPAGPRRAAGGGNLVLPGRSAPLRRPGCRQRQTALLRDAPTAKLFPSRAGGAGRFQPCEKRLVPPSAGNPAHLSKHISTCQRELYRGQLKKALASAGSPGLPGEIKGTRGGF